MEKKIQATKTVAFFGCVREGVENLFSQFGRNAFINVHVQQPVARSSIDAFVALVAVVFSRFAGRIKQFYLWPGSLCEPYGSIGRGIINDNHFVHPWKQVFEKSGHVLFFILRDSDYAER